ncbi:MAG: hypothetical protein HOW73_18605 [Polyangiaceae bacterium]|nr:hypothetical protein [Polyangiaceae bacterium]
MANSVDVAAWLRSNAVRLSTLSPDAPLDDLEPLRTLIGNARFVALGEGAHFIDELWTVRQTPRAATARSSSHRLETAN